MCHRLTSHHTPRECLTHLAEGRRSFAIDDLPLACSLGLRSPPNVHSDCIHPRFESCWCAVARSIFINSNLARVLLASYKLTGERAHLNEGLSWCDAFVDAQVPSLTHDGTQMGGWWNTGYDDLYIADTGTAVTALALCHDLHPKPEYLQAMTRFATFVEGGTAQTPQCEPMLPKHPTCSFDGGRMRRPPLRCTTSANSA